MAKAKLLSVKALVNLKYDKNCYKIGEKLKVRNNEAEAMAAKGCIVLLEEIPKDNDQDNKQDGDGEDPDEPPKVGE